MQRRAAALPAAARSPASVYPRANHSTQKISVLDAPSRTMRVMAAVQLILLHGFHDPEGNRLLDLLEKHARLESEPVPDNHGPRYHIAAETHEGAETFSATSSRTSLSNPSGAKVSR